MVKSLFQVQHPFTAALTAARGDARERIQLDPFRQRMGLRGGEGLASLPSGDETPGGMLTKRTAIVLRKL